MNTLSVCKRAVLVACVLSFAGCGGGGGDGGSSPTPVTPSPPASSPSSGFTLTLSQPTHGASGITRQGVIVLEFSSDVSAATVNAQSVKLSTRDGPLESTVQTTGKTIRITPTRRLAPGELHTVSVATTVGDTAGNALRQALQLSFTTSGANWQPPAPTGIGDCGHSINIRAVLLDDGSVLAACAQPRTVDSTNNPPVRLRSPAGIWSAAVTPPTPSSRVSNLRKLSGNRVLVRWLEFQAPANTSNYIYQTWDTGSGASAPLTLVGGEESFGQADYLRLRALLQSEVPVGESVAYQNVLELVSSSTGEVLRSYRNPGRQITNVQLCRFASGERQVVYGSRPASADYSIADARVHAINYTPAAGWQKSVQLGSGLSQIDLSIVLSCGPSGVARAFWYNQAGSISKFADLAGSAGWQAARDRSTSSQLVRDSQLYVYAAVGDDGSAFMAWYDWATNPNAVATPNGSLSKVPRNFLLAPGASAYVPDVSMPNYAPGLTHDTSVIAVAYNPSARRYLAVIWGGLLGSPRLMASDVSAAEGWSNPWSLPALFTAGFVVDFNASGAGILAGTRDGETYVSDWR